MSVVIDYSSGVPLSDSIKSAGYVGTVRYLSGPRPGAEWMKGKPVSKTEVESQRRHGLGTAFVWQYGKEKSPDVMRGFQGGVEDARNAQRKLDEIGRSGQPVFFAVDFNIALWQWNDTAVHYFKGAISVLGLNRVGIYGHSRVCAWAIEDNVVGHSSTKGKRWVWQTKAWSNGERTKEAVLYQGTLDVPGPNGVGVDLNEVLADDWGQLIPKTSRPTQERKEEPVMAPISKKPGWKGDPVWLADALRAFGVEVVELPGWKDWGMGDFGSVWGTVAHHTGGNETPSSLIQYGHSALRGLLSQVHLRRDGVAVMCGVGTAYHAGVGSWPGLPTNNANQHTIGIEANSDGQTPWPTKQLDAYYRACAALVS